MGVFWRGAVFNAANLTNHYRRMATRQPGSASFWRGLARQVVAAAREQAMPQLDLAA